MKKLLNIMVAVSVITIGFISINVFAGADTPIVKLDGRKIEFPDAKPYVNGDNRTMVPVRFVSEALGCTVDWEETRELVIISKAETRILLHIGDNSAIVNTKASDVRKEFDTKAVLKNDRTMVPLRFISETLGVGVAWDEANNTVILRSDGTVEAVATPTPAVTPIPKATPTLLNIDLNEYPIFQEFAAIDGFKSAGGQKAPWYSFRYGEINLYNNNNNDRVLAFDYNAADTGKKYTKKANFYVDKYDEKNMERFKKVLSLVIPDAQDELYNLSVQYFGGKTEIFDGYICDGKYNVYIEPYNEPQYPTELQGAYIAVINGGQ